MPNDVPDWTTTSVMTEQAIPNSPFTIPRNGSPFNINGVQVPVGCQWLVIATQLKADLVNVSVVGTTTNVNYAVSSAVVQTAIAYVRVHPAIDGTVNLQITPPNTSGSFQVGIAFGFAPTVNDLDPFSPSPVFLEATGGTAISTPQNASAIPDVGVQIENPHPIGALSANVNGSIGSSGLLAGGTFTLFGGGGANVHTYLRKIQVKIGAAVNSFGTFECPSGTVRGNWSGASADTYDFDFDWLDCGANTALIIKNTSAVSSGSINGHATANQS